MPNGNHFQARAIDIHTHVNFAVFNEDKLRVMGRARAAGVAMINVGTQQSTSHSAVELAKAWGSGVYAAVGLHPAHTFSTYHDTDELGGLEVDLTSRSEKFDYHWYKKLATEPEVVAIGECGLDYFRLEGDQSRAEELITKQKEVFEAQVCLAEELGKPLMLHLREAHSKQFGRPSAYQDALDILKKHQGVTGNVHFFAGSLSIAEKFLQLGFTLSFTGVITFTESYDDLIRRLPLDRLLVETDAPYVTPVPYRGQRNEPAYVWEVIKRLAELRGLTKEEVASQTLDNASRLFRLEAI